MFAGRGACGTYADAGAWTCFAFLLPFFPSAARWRTLLHGIPDIGHTWRRTGHVVPHPMSDARVDGVLLAGDIVGPAHASIARSSRYVLPPGARAHTRWGDGTGPWLVSPGG